MKKSIMLSVLLLLGVASASSATLIDFTSGACSGADGLQSFSCPSAGLTIEAGPTPALISVQPGDGLGVYGLEDPSTYDLDEVEGIERLLLHFDVPQYLNAILITDLYNEMPSKNFDPPYVYRETGEYSFNGTTWVPFQAENDQVYLVSNGELTIDPPGLPLVSDIWFRAPGWISQDRVNVEGHTFSVGGIDIRSTPAPVPEPATMLLLGVGLVGLGGFRRKFKK